MNQINSVARLARRVLQGAALLLAATAAPAYAQICGTPLVTPLMAGQHMDAGAVTAWNDENGVLYVGIHATGEWRISESHLAVADSLEGIPQTRSGNPKVGRFEWQRSYEPPVADDVYVIDGHAVGDELVIALHAVVAPMGAGGETGESETAWAAGEPFPGRSWATWFRYTLQPCEPPPEEEEILPGDFRTQTQGGWGSVCRGNNPGCYRDAHFDATFPGGLLIGEGGEAALFTASAAVRDFLPQGGTPAALDGYSVDPLATAAGVLAGQVTALTLSVHFDQADADFGASDTALADLVAVEGACAGMSVAAILDAANQALAGGGGFAPSAINGCVSAINENFVDGTEVGDYLRLP